MKYLKPFISINEELKKSNTLEFIEKAKKVHGDKYDYSKVEYVNKRCPVKIFCKKHEKTFLQRPGSHLQGSGCPYCFGNFKYATDEFIEKAKKVHGDKYDYSKVEYVNSRIPVEIICKKHTMSFTQIPNGHLRGQNCPVCAKGSTTDEFIEKAKKVHGNKYDYSGVEYNQSNQKVEILCKKHNFSFQQSPSSHLSGSGCPLCNESKGELFVVKSLDNIGIRYERNKRFTDCVGLRPLPFDFYLPDYNMCIEYDGEQHFNPFDRFGGEEKLLTQKHRDNLKTEYCEKNGIKLLRINYKISGYQNILKYIKDYFSDVL